MNNNSILQSVKNLGVKYNVSFKVIDSRSGKTVQTHQGHNAATNSILTGIGHYLVGDGVLNQASTMLSSYIPKYISLGTMGLLSQSEDGNSGLPTGIDYDHYMEQIPGFGADGYSSALNNNRPYFGLGPQFEDTAVDCELISSTFPRFPITYRSVLSAAESETQETIDVIFSAMISTGALKQFRGDNDYIFITEAGLWNTKEWMSTNENGDNGLLAGYRIVSPDPTKWDLSIPENQLELQKQILRVGVNQVVQVIWKLQLGAIDQLVAGGGSGDLYWNRV